MSLASITPNYFSEIDYTVEAPATTWGSAINSGTAGAKGSWVNISGGTLATECFMFRLSVIANTSSAGLARRNVIDIGVDPAGGTSYTAIITDFLVGSPVPRANGAADYIFAMGIPAGASVGCRTANIEAQTFNIRLAALYYGKAASPFGWNAAQYSETIGGTFTAVTPGTNAFGSWTSIGTTTKALRWFQVGIGINNATQSSHGTRVQMAVGDGTNFDPAIVDFIFTSDTSERQGMPIQWPCIKPVPAGSDLYVRMNNGGTPVTGYGCNIVGIG